MAKLLYKEMFPLAMYTSQFFIDTAKLIAFLLEFYILCIR